MGQEIGSAYVTIIPSTKGLGRQIERDIDGGVATGTKKGGSSFLAGVGRWVGKATLAGAAVAGAFTIKGGISRLMAIDDAEGKLKGLGYSTEDIAAVMDNALAAVKGTAFGLGDAATAAAGAIASGIKPGKQLENYLRLVGDAATIAGADFTEMGAIFGKVTAKGKLGMEEVNQLQERGIPIMQWLADEYGATGEAMSKMVSQGKVDAKTFRKVIKENIGGAAQESGKTFRGALANLQASLGRIGANLFGPLFKASTPTIGSLTKALEPLERAAKRVGEALKTGIGWIGENIAPIATFLGLIVAMGTAVEVWNTAQKVLNALLAINPITIWAVAIAAIAAGVVWLYQNVTWFRDGVDAAWSAISDAVTTAWEQHIRPALQGFARIVRNAWEAAQPTLDQLRDGFIILGRVIKDAWENDISPALTSLWATIQDAWVTIQPALEQLRTVVDELGQSFGGWQVPLQAAGILLGLVFVAIISSIRIATTIIRGAITQFQFFVNLISGPLARAIAVGATVLRFFGQQFTAFKEAIGSVKSALSGLGGAISSAIQFFQNLVTGVRAKITATIAVVKTLPGRVTGALSGAGSWLANAGRQVIQGFIDGIRNMFGSVQSTLGELTSKLTSWKGPPKRDRVILRGAGQLIMRGLVDGLKSGESGVKKQLGEITKAIARALDLKQISKTQAKNMKALVERTAKNLTKLAAKISAHQDKLNEMLKDRASLKSSIADALGGELDLGSLVQENEPLTFDQVSTYVANVAARLRTFAGKISELIRKGIPLALVQEIAGLGSEKGIAVADALLSGTSQQVADLSSSYTGVTNAAAAVGEAIAAEMFDAGIQAQKGLIAGLLEDKAIKVAAKKLAKALTKAVRKELGIKSPSRVMRDKVGRYLLPGAQAGVDATLPAFRSHIADALNVSDLAVSPLSVPAMGGSSAQSTSAGRPIEIHQHAVPYIPTEKQMLRAWREAEILYGVSV